jgi:hypothetical protein
LQVPLDKKQILCYNKDVPRERGKQEILSPRKKHLTSSTKCDKIYMKRTRTVQKTGKDTIMKKLSMETLVNYIDSHNVEELFAIKDELTAELSKGKAKADANREVYAEIHDKVIKVLSGTTAPVTAQDLADETGVARGKIVYGLNKYWADEVVVDTTGKVHTYRLA